MPELSWLRSLHSTECVSRTIAIGEEKGKKKEFTPKSSEFGAPKTKIKTKQTYLLIIVASVVAAIC